MLSSPPSSPCFFGVAARPAAAGYSAQLDAGTLKLKGDAASDKLLLHLQPGAPGTLQADIGADGTADFSFDRSTFTAIDVDGGTGDDEIRVFQGFGAFFDEQLTIDGGAGDDLLLGGSGAETLNGGRGDDVVAGGDGNDTALLGSGNDRFTWNPGDDSDTVEGEGGDDRLEFNGSSASEFVGITPNGGRTRFTRNIAAIAMDLDGVERIGFRALGGSDAVIVDELTGTGVKSVEIDLHASGGTAGDGQPDTVVAGGTNDPDKVTISSTAGNVLVDGLAADVQVAGGESAHDNIDVATSGGADTINAGVGITGPAAINVDGGDDVDTVRYSGTDGPDVIDVASNGPEPSAGTAGSSRVESAAVESFVILGLAGADTIAGVGNLAPLTALTFDGGDDDDILLGGNGADLLLGGKGSDFVDGNQGADRALMGPDGDTFQWDPGDGNDTVEGQGGDDRLLFNGSGAAETIAISADAGRTRLTRNIANIVDGSRRRRAAGGQRPRQLRHDHGRRPQRHRRRLRRARPRAGRRCRRRAGGHDRRQRQGQAGRRPRDPVRRDRRRRRPAGPDPHCRRRGGKRHAAAADARRQRRRHRRGRRGRPDRGDRRPGAGRVDRASPSPSSAARRAASRRVAAPSFESTAATWCSAVRGETTSRSAISAFVRPSVTSASTSSWRAVESGRVGTRGHPLARRNAQPERAQPARDAPRQRLGAEPAGDLDRLDEALLVVEQREHQRPVVGPADVAVSVGRPAPVAPEHRGMGCGLRWVELDRDPGDRRARRHPNRAPADQTAGRPRLVQQRLEPLCRHRRAGGQRPLGLELDERRQSLRLARANGLRREIGEALRRIRVAAAHSQLGERGLGDELRDADALLELGARDPLGLVPLPCPQLQPRERDSDVRGEVVHLVLLGVGDRLPGIPNRRLGLRPGHQRVAEVAESARRLVLVADLVREGVGLEERPRPVRGRRRG